MDWKSTLGNVAKAAYEKGEDWGARYKDERDKASRMSDAELIRAIKSGSGSQTRISALYSEASARGLKKK